MTKDAKELTDEGEALLLTDVASAIAKFKESLKLDPRYRRASYLKKEAYKGAYVARNKQ